MVKLLFILGMITTPFSDFVGLRVLGEMQHDLSGHIMTLCILLYGFTGYVQWHNIGRYKANYSYRPNAEQKLLIKILNIFLLVILLSFLANFSVIINTYAMERYGLGKLFASTCMIIYGFAFAFLGMGMGKKYDWNAIIVKPLAICVGVCAFFAILEGLSFRFGGFFANLQLAVSEFTHAGSRGQAGLYGVKTGAFGWYDDTAGRTRSVSFEAPAFADALGMVFPWIFAGFIQKKRGYGIICLIDLVLMYFSGARTGYLFIAMSILIAVILRYGYLSTSRTDRRIAVLNFSFVCLIFLSILAYIYTYNDAVKLAVDNYSERDGRSISTLTRLTMITSGWDIFLKNPVFGIGFGQYGFQVINFIPSWSWQSWEIRAWFLGNTEVWVSTFCAYVRFAAEMGIPGLFLWCGTWLGLAWYVLKATISHKRKTGIILNESYPLIMSCFAVLLHGVASDALHMPLIWVDLGLCCLFIKNTRAYIENRK